MKNAYDYKSIEEEWAKRWVDEKTYATPDQPTRPKRYILDMFPYPSGEGLHVGHVEGYTATDVYSRYTRLQGFDVLHPIGWDAFGLPAENYAIKRGLHPKQSTEKNIANFKRQIQSLGFSYSWKNELSSADPEYYRWTQWMFLQLHQAGLAYQKDAAVNWCENDQTVLANEQVINGCCERCGGEVVQKNMRQWFFKITDYAEELLTGLDTLNWPDAIKSAQRNWIGRSEGLTFSAPVKDTDLVIDTFSAHFEACYADTFVVIAPEHPLLATLVAGTKDEKEVLRFAAGIVKERATSREEREPTGIFTGRYIINPLDGQELPIWVASFAIAHYGTGIVKCSAHDERDFAFAKKYDLPLKVCLLPSDPAEAERVKRFEYCYSDMKHGILTEPAEVAGKTGGEAHEAVIKHCEKHGFAKRAVTYKLRDWLISRQRYWGAPIPIIHCESCGAVPVPESELPVVLPDDVDFRPHGHSPLADVASFVNMSCPKCGGAARRETDTMDTFVCSSWYYLRYPSNTRSDVPFGKTETENWLPVDTYVGGAEHAVLHLLYARFFTKFLRDQKLLTFDEPFTQLYNVGMILGPDHAKMSKSKGNIINPDDVVAEVGVDALRLHELFMGPFVDEKPWNTKTIKGVRRFLDQVWRISEAVTKGGSLYDQAALHAVIKKVTNDTAAFRFNTAIAALMTLANGMQVATPDRESFKTFLTLLLPYAPHLVSELFEQLYPAEAAVVWPSYDEALLVHTTVTLSVQVNGKLRGTCAVDTDSDDTVVTAAAKAVPNVDHHLAGKTIRQTIIVKNRLVNFVVTD